MTAHLRTAWLAGLMVCTAVATSAPAVAQTGRADGITDLLRQGLDKAGQLTQGIGQAPGGQKPAQPALEPMAPAPAADPRAGDPAHEQAQRLMKAIDAILQDTARNRSEAKKLPSKNDFLVPPLWTETREDREAKIKTLLDATLGIVSDVPVVEVQKRIDTLKKNIRDLDDRIVKLREKQLTAPKDGFLPGYVTDTVESLKTEIEDTKTRIGDNRGEIAKAKREVFEGLAKSGVKLTEGQVDLLLDGVLSGDLVRLVAVFDAAKAIDAQLAKLMSQSGENIGAARRYFAMHAALFAMVVHAQDSLVGKIDSQYLPKLQAITKDVGGGAKAARKSCCAPRTVPTSGVRSKPIAIAQKLADDAAKGYRRYLLQQREQVARARRRAAHDLRIADNTYETVEASYQLRQLMKDSASSFEAIQKLEAPTFEQISATRSCARSSKA